MPPPALPRGVETTISGVEPDGVFAGGRAGAALGGGVPAEAALGSGGTSAEDWVAVVAEEVWLRMSKRSAAAERAVGRKHAGREGGEELCLIGRILADGRDAERRPSA